MADEKSRADVEVDLDLDGGLLLGLDASEAILGDEGELLEGRGVRVRARGTALHVATDDKQALARLAGMGSVPVESPTAAIRVRSPPLVAPPNTQVSAPEWRDEELEDFEEYGRGNGADLCEESSTMSVGTLLPPPPEPVPAPAFLFSDPSPTATSSSSSSSTSRRAASLALELPPHLLTTTTTTSLGVPSPSRVLYYSPLEEAIMETEGELGPSAPPFAEYELAEDDGEGSAGSRREREDCARQQQQQPSAPPLFEEDDEFDLDDLRRQESAEGASAPPMLEGLEDLNVTIGPGVQHVPPRDGEASVDLPS